MNRSWIGTAALLLAVAVALGAFGAHGLKERLSEYSLDVYEKAVFYHFIHAIGILIVASLPTEVLAEAASNRVCLLLAAGIGVFSGSLYILAITNIRWLGAITPLGGTAFIIAWGMLAYELLSD